ncbi:MAG: MarR family transcriptional regulator [Bacillota bacterium]|nr:MarR family transcriptional regulator [Bacillota bacterium]
MDEIGKSLEVSKLFREIMILLRHSMAKSFEDMGITAPQGMVLRTLGHNEKMKISDLSSHLGLSNSTVSGIVDRLEKQGMVERIRSEEDRRVVYVSSSPKFEKLHKELHNRAEENIRNIMKRGTPEDIDKVIDGLNTLKKLLTNDK